MYPGRLYQKKGKFTMEIIEIIRDAIEDLKNLLNAVMPLPVMELAYIKN